MFRILVIEILDLFGVCNLMLGAYLVIVSCILKFMLEISKDLLYLVMAFCILWVTIFFCWLLYYIISIVGQMRNLIKSVKEKINKVDELINLIKEKVEHSATYLGVMVAGIEKIVDYVKERKNKNETGSQKKSRSKKIKVVEEE